VATPLTEEEKRVLKLLVVGRTGKEIAVELGSSDGTVRTAIQSILTKLRIHSRLEKAVAALLSPDPSPLPPAASAALAVPRQRAEDIPRHIGRFPKKEPGTS
jgi:DNA-binding CsgD family transcriptional regulator